MLAAGVSLVLIANAIAKVIAQLQSGPVATTITRLAPVEDSDGKIVRDVNGAPLLYWRNEQHVSESKNLENELAVGVALPFGIKVELTTKDRASS